MEAPKVATVVWVENSKVQEHGAWVKDLSVTGTLRRERTEGRWRVMLSEERVVGYG